MSSAPRVLLPPAAAKSPRKRAKTQRKRKTGPTVSELILKAASASPERGSVSLAALKKALKAGGYDVVTNKARVLTAIKRLVASKSLVQTKGTGAAGSFRLNKKPPTPRKTALKKKKKPKTKRVKRTSPRKAAGDDATPAAKRSPKKRSKSKSPAKCPRKAKRRTVRSTRTRAAATAAAAKK